MKGSWKWTAETLTNSDVIRQLFELSVVRVTHF